MQRGRERECLAPVQHHRADAGAARNSPGTPQKHTASLTTPRNRGNQRASRQEHCYGERRERERVLDLDLERSIAPIQPHRASSGAARRE